MNYVSQGSEPQPSLAWTFESSNVDYVTNLSPSSQVSPGPAQLQGSAALVTNAPTSNTAVYFPGTTGSYMNLGTNSPINFNLSTSNIFVECWIYLNSGVNWPAILNVGPPSASPYAWHWSLSFSSSTSKPRVGIRYNTYNLDSSISCGFQTWSHVSFSYVPSTSTAYIFVNGQSGGSMSAVEVANVSTETTLIGTYTDFSTYANMYIRDLRVVQGGIVPTTSFTPSAAPFTYTLPSYVTGSGSVVFTLLGQFVTYPSGKYGSAISVVNRPVGSGNNSNAYLSWTVTTPLSGVTVVSGTTISLWLNFFLLPTSGECAIFYITNGGTGQIGLSVNSTSVLWKIGDGAGNYYSGSSTSYPVIGTWYHYTITASNGTAQLYINGSLASSSVGSYPLTSTWNLSFAYVASVGTYGPTSALYDDLRIYKTALTAAQVQSIYTQGGAPASQFRAMPQPALAWGFDGTTTDYISGVVPTTSAGFSYAAGKYKQCVSFINTVGSAPTNYIVYDFNAISSSAFTVCCWINTVVSSSGGIAVAIAGGNREGDVRIVIGGSSPGNALCQYRMLTALPSTYTFVNATSATNSVVAGVWNHVAVTITESSVNGTVLSCFFNGSLASTYTSAYGAPRNLNGVGVGAFYDLLFNNGFNGSVDDLRIYSSALSSAQVQSIYNAQGMPSRIVEFLPAPLDALSPSGAYSTRLLRSAYTGPVVNVRRNSDNATLDFIADQFGNLSNTQSAATIDTWLASTTGNVTTWYDQAYSNNFTQTVPVAQPQIVKNGGKWVLFFNRNASPTFYSNLQLATTQTGIYSIVYNANLLSTYNSYQTLLGQAGNDNIGFRFNNNLLYGDSTQSGGRYGSDFLAAAGSYWYLNGQYGDMIAGAPSVPSVIDPNGNNGVYTSGIWNHIIGVENGGLTTLPFNAISAPQSTLINRAAYGYLAEVIMFKTKLSDIQSRSLYSSQYISRQLVNMSGVPLFSRLSTSAVSTAVGAYSLRAINGTVAKAVQVKRSSDNAQQDFWADRLGNLLTTPISGQTLANWLGGASGNIVTLYDQSGSGNHATQATAANQPTIIPSPVGSGYVVQFLSVGSGNFLTPSTLNLGSINGSYTKSVWTYVTSNTNQFQNFLTTSTAATGQGINILGWNFPAASSVPYFSFTQNTYSVNLTGSGQFALNAWNHLAATYNNPTQTVLLYLNGTQIYSNTAFTSSFNPGDGALATGFRIGRGFGNQCISDNYDALVFNSALSAADISTLYSAR
jgi:Concanavalin A-like lectin/glucanases superfamily/Alpha-L-arabinofuranosidase B, catalytic